MKSRHVLVTALAFGFIAFGVVMPGLRRGVPSSSNEMQCVTNLRHLQIFGAIYADKKDGYFPREPDGSITSLQQLADAFPEDFRPEHFVCPSGKEAPASRVDRRLTLSNGCSYEAVPWRLKSSERNAILFYDNMPRHRGGRLVVLTDGTPLFVDEDTFQRRFKEERTRFSVPTTETTPKRPK